MTEYRIGLGISDITPPVGTPLGGNFRSDYASRGVFEPLKAHAMIVKQGDTTAALVSCDLLFVNETMTDKVRRQVAKSCGLKPEAVLVAATHTHSGPATTRLTGDARMTIDEATEDELCRKIAMAVEAAHKDLSPATLKVGEFKEDTVSFNRRLRMKDGTTRMNWERPPIDQIDGTWGPTDPQGVVLGVFRDETLAGLVVNFSLHAAVLAGDNWLMSPDWPGFMREALHKTLGPDVIVLYFNGAEGNINHIDAWDPKQGRGFKEIQRIGYVLGLDVFETLRRLEPIDGPLRVGREQMSLQRRRISPEAVQAARRRLEEMGDVAPEGQEDGLPQSHFDKELIKHAERMHEPVALEAMTLRLGDLAMGSFQGEFLTEFGLDLKRRSPARWTMPIGLANGGVGYVPVPETIEQGGYEGNTSSHNQLALDAGSRVVDCLVGQLEQHFGS